MTKNRKDINYNFGENNDNLGYIDRKLLLDNLIRDIALEFGLKKETTKNLIKKETLVGIDSLRKELQKNIDNSVLTEDNKLTEKNIEKLFLTLKSALEVVENYSITERQTLKEDVEKSINIESFKNSIERYLPSKLISKAKNPKKIHEHILGITLGTTNSIVTTVEILYKLGKGIIQTPYHLYMIASGKAETNSFKNI